MSPPLRFTVAIDGPAAAGKGTVAAALARHFGLRHLDTGLLYRATALRAAERGEPPGVAAAALTEADLARPDLRTAEAGQAASRIATLPEVRRALLAFQRRFAQQPGGAVLDGRDIGTVICPEAEVKLYVTASPEARARRRWLELGGTAAAVSLPQILAEVEERDRRDMTRSTAPLRPAADALVLDTSRMSIEQAVSSAISAVDGALARRS